MEKTCPFCVPEPSRLLVSEGLVLALRDGYPVSPGHSLIVPRRHVGSFGEASLEEQSAMLAMLQRVRAMLDAELRLDGYNIGINEGAAAGQTVMHVHMHVIPRYRGDRPDPRGGIRWIIPEKADYWSGRGKSRLRPATRRENVSQFLHSCDMSGGFERLQEVFPADICLAADRAQGRAFDRGVVRQRQRCGRAVGIVPSHRDVFALADDFKAKRPQRAEDSRLRRVDRKLLHGS